MLKFIVILTKIVVTTAIGLLFASCQFQGIKGSGNVTTENRIVNGKFKSIKVEKGLEVILEQSQETKVTVVADDNLQKHILVKVSNGVLIITSDYSSYSNVKSKKILVKTLEIESIEVTGGANLSSKNTLKNEALTLKSSSGGNLKTQIETERANCESSSGSTISVSGKAIDLKISSSGGSNIDAEKLLSNTIIAKASSGSTLTVYPLVLLNAEASSGATIKYYNIPRNLNKKTGSGGAINKE